MGGAGLALALVVGGALGAPARGPRPEREGGEERAEFSPEQARERLRDRLEQVEGEAAALREAVRRLDAGEPWEDVRATLPWREGAPGGFERLRERPGDGADEGPMRGARERWREGRRERFEPLTPEESAELVALLREVDPEGAARFEAFEGERPAMAPRLLRMIEPRLREIERLRETDPGRSEALAEQFRVESAIMHTARTLHETVAGGAGGDLDAARERLRALVSRQVDLQLELRALDLERGADRLEKARLAVAEERAKRDEMIAERVDRILERAIRGGLDRLDRPEGMGRPGPGAR